MYNSIHWRIRNGQDAAATVLGQYTEWMESAAAAISRLTRRIPDFPKPGVLFQDLTPVFEDAGALRAIASELAALGPFDLVAGIEARGFLVATATAMLAHTGVLAIRKAGKLPGEVVSTAFELEYNTATIELHPNRGKGAPRVLIVDDVLATGGTGAAAADLLKLAGYMPVGFGMVLEIDGLGGAAKLASTGLPLHSIAHGQESVQADASALIGRAQTSQGTSSRRERQCTDHDGNAAPHEDAQFATGEMSRVSERQRRE